MESDRQKEKKTRSFHLAQKEDLHFKFRDCANLFTGATLEGENN